VPVNAAVTVVQAPAHTLGLAAEKVTVGKGRHTTCTALEISKQGSFKFTLPLRLLPAMAAA
jgi:hypothetical protein